jgi:hypothetical protein
LRDDGGIDMTGPDTNSECELKFEKIIILAGCSVKRRIGLQVARLKTARSRELRRDRIREADSTSPAGMNARQRKIPDRKTMFGF